MKKTLKVKVQLPRDPFTAKHGSAVQRAERRVLAAAMRPRIRRGVGASEHHCKLCLLWEYEGNYRQHTTLCPVRLLQRARAAARKPGRRAATPKEAK
jgi:hypothetical protein